MNFITDKTWETGVTTDPVVVDALVRYFKTRVERIVVVESDTTTTNADKAALKTGILDVCRGGIRSSSSTSAGSKTG